MDNSDIIIKMADKNGAVVILNKTDYIAESHNILSDLIYYRPLKEDPTPIFHKSYTNLINKAFDDTILNKKERDFLTIRNPTMPIFYYLPKIHKNETSPTGRPIIAGIDSLSSHLSKYVDLNLQKYVSKLPAYLKDTTDMNQVVQDIAWQPWYKWATLDVSALYSNIPNQKGIESVGVYLMEDYTVADAILDSISFLIYSWTQCIQF